LAGRVVVVGDVGDVVDAAQGGQHRSDAVRSARWAGSLHQVYEPVVAGVDQRERGISVQSSPVLGVQGHNDLLAVAPFEQIVGAGIPDTDGAGTVFAFGDGALKCGVFQWMVFGG